MSLTSKQIADFAWQRYRGCSTARVLNRFRPAICPLDLVVQAIPRGSSVLDIGCGSGLLLSYLARCGQISRGVGVDLSPGAIATACKANSGESGIEFLCVKAADPWPTEPCDVVTLIDVLHHVAPDQQRRFIERLKGLSAAKIIIKDLAPRPRWKAWMNALHDGLMTRSRVWPVEMQRVADWLGEDGFAVESASRADRLWYNHYLITARARAGKERQEA
ncbi:MAG: class I SAM-dependent methyltransferase [Planctomycetaceae bacterium]|nr:class I SAM-dependent methyltransferase [Planctomycetaceae bacterium]